MARQWAPGARVRCASVGSEIDATYGCAGLTLLDMHLERPAGPRVEELLKKTLFYLLKAAQKVARRAKRDSEMADVEI